MSLYPIKRIKKNKKVIYVYKNGSRVTNKSILHRINKLKIPPAYQDVFIFNKNANVQYTARDSKKRIQKGYHLNYIQKKRNVKKFKELVMFITIYPTLMKKINTILKNNIVVNKKYIYAIIIKLIDTCKIRPGNDKYLNDTGSYGAITLCKKHFTKKKKTIHLKFKGKSKVVNECDIDIKDILGKRLLKLIHKNNNNSCVFNNFNIKIRPRDINIFLHELTGKKILIKYFRHYHANLLFLNHVFMLKNHTTIKDRTANAKHIVKKSADILHHTPTIFKSSYLYMPIHDLYIHNYSDFKKIFRKKSLESNVVKYIKKTI